MPRIKKTKVRDFINARVIADMLMENTGTHMLDSGGANGRMWQRNRAAVGASRMTAVEYFEAQPVSTFGWPCVGPHESHRDPDYKVNGGTQAELWVNHSVYHWLKEAVEYNAEADAMLDKLAEQMDEGKDRYDRPSWFEIYREFPDYYARQMAIKAAEENEERIEWNATREEGESEMTAEDWVEMHGYDPATGIYGDGDYAEGYTYNEENCLSQDIHWIYFEHESIDHGEGIALIMIHGGADARGGFTRPRAFTAWIEGDSPSWFDWSRYGICCDNHDCQAMWSGNGGYEESAEWNGSDYADHEVLALSEYNAREGDKIDAAFLNASTGVLAPGEKPWIVIEQPGQYPTSEGTKVYCPVCGTGELQPWFY